MTFYSYSLREDEFKGNSELPLETTNHEQTKTTEIPGLLRSGKTGLPSHARIYKKLEKQTPLIYLDNLGVLPERLNNVLTYK